MVNLARKEVKESQGLLWTVPHLPGLRQVNTSLVLVLPPLLTREERGRDGVRESVHGVCKRLFCPEPVVSCNAINLQIRFIR
jgi:hypothetical protein